MVKNEAKSVRTIGQDAKASVLGSTSSVLENTR
jgi:hypothetical protein